ncbi:hypothetical protein L6164_000117 [Bauhinia variegata]|uniref:Uncharacterized protein n=1 Tax=Bauhinia variegata TaxID=167791 RepID=A0ACB9Q5G8_BAUVA|nr:hypothetical protein L6164_000117 [Bauhinia variegata]
MTQKCKKCGLEAHNERSCEGLPKSKAKASSTQDDCKEKSQKSQFQHPQQLTKTREGGRKKPKESRGKREYVTIKIVQAASARTMFRLADLIISSQDSTRSIVTLHGALHVQNDN